MTPDLPLFQAAARYNDHAISKAAAEAVTRVTGKIAARVLAYAASRPNGFIDDDLKLQWPDEPESSYRKRRSELTKAGYLTFQMVPKNGIHVAAQRKNRHGRDETVWVITTKGRAAL